MAKAKKATKKPAAEKEKDQMVTAEQSGKTIKSKDGKTIPCEKS